MKLNIACQHQRLYEQWISEKHAYTKGDRVKQDGKKAERYSP